MKSTDRVKKDQRSRERQIHRDHPNAGHIQPRYGFLDWERGSDLHETKMTVTEAIRAGRAH